MDATQFTEVDYAKLAGSSRAVILGETHHHTREYQLEIVNSLIAFKKLGFSHFGMEMLHSDWNVTRTQSTADKISSHFEPEHALVFNEAIRLNLTVIPLDMPYDKQDEYGNFTEKRYRDRNYWMAKEAQKVLNKGHKMVLFIHLGHALSGTGSLEIGDKDGVRALLKAKSISTSLIQLAGGKWDGDMCLSRVTPASALAQHQNLHNTRFSTTGAHGIDHVVHLPQNCKIR